MVRPPAAAVWGMLSVEVDELAPLPDDCCDAELPPDWVDCCWALVADAVADMVRTLCTSRNEW